MTSESGRKMAVKSLLLVCLIFTILTSSMGFNLDLPSYIRHRGHPGSMFGFSIALHRASASSMWVIVGAPKANNSYYQASVHQPGAVWRCDIQEDDHCRMVPFDSKPHQTNERGEQIDTKSNQWLGATVVTSSGENGLIVACAPRYVYHSMTPKTRFLIEPVGTCFTSRNFTSFAEYSPCRTNLWGYHRQGTCQAGFSAGVSRNGDRLYIGAPGSWYWQGQAFSIDADSRFPYKPPMYQEFGVGGQSYSYSVTDPRSRVYSTKQSGPSYDDTYLGYSTITGDFDGDGEDDVAIGMPRGEGLLGKVTLWKWNMINFLNITGRQVGAYFGYSMCTSDVDGDGYDDLIVGAPMHNEPNNEEKYDVGRVYIMLQGKNPREKYMKEFYRDGINSKGRFGLSLTTLGDINQDGYGDFAVGAPYDGPNGNGAVYVFHGSIDGALPKPSQVIYSEDVIGPRPPRTFGFALSGGIDLDGNLYPDLAVGAYAADEVIVFRSRPVAVVDATATFLSPSKLINLDDKSCKTRRGGKDVPCTAVRSCWRYTGINLPSILDFQVSWVLDSRRIKAPRMFFLSDETKNIRNSTIRLERGKTHCQNETVYLKDNVRDKLTPLEVELRYQLPSNRPGQPLVRRKRDLLQPVIDQNREIVQRDFINIQKNCGMDNICVPDLRLEIKTVNKYLLGSREPLVVEVLISNFGEDAFEAGFYMTMPEDLNFKKIQQIGDARETPITCTAPTQATNYTLKCDIGNPLPSGKISNFKVVMIPSAKVGMASSYDFFMEANSTNTEKEGSGFDNIIRKSIGIWVETELAIEGTSFPEFAHYKASDYKAIENATKESDLGPHVVHIYNIRNNGPSNIEEAVVFIHFPYQTLGDDVLMYLLNQPETDGNIKCDPNLNVNPLNLQLDQGLARRSYLESIGAVIRSSPTGSTAQQTGVHIQRTSGSSTISTGSTSKVITEEQKRIFKEEETKESTGDASLVHNERANEAAAAAAAANIAYGRPSYVSSSWNSSSTSGGQGPSVVVTTRNRTITYGADGKPQVVESSTEYVRNLDRQPINMGSSHATYSQRTGGGAGAAGGNDGREWINQGGAVSEQQTGSRQTFQQNAQPGTGNYRTSSQFSTSYRPGETTYSRQAAAGRGFNDLQGISADKIAAGQGFRTGTLDLGTLDRGNVDDHIRHSSSYSSGNLNRGNADDQLRQSATFSTSGSTGGSLGGGSSTYSRSSSSSDPTYSQRYWSQKEKPYYGTADTLEYYYDQDENPRHSEYSSSSSSGNTFGGRRQKREVDDGTIILGTIAPCKDTKCATLRCVAKNLGNNDGVWVAIRTRLVAKTMEKLASDVPLNVSTKAVSHVTRLPYIGEPKEEIIRSHEVFYKAIPEPIPAPDIIPLWIVILAACVGALILLLLVFLLHTCGFFNRKRPTDHSQERQPLRNGYHGDEHL